MGHFSIQVPDRQLACVPVRSPEGQAYLAAMAAAANYGRANRQLLTEATRRVFDQETSTTLDVLYDVSHNLAKIETHRVDGQTRTVCVHRKGATRSLPPTPSRRTRRTGDGRPAGADTGHDGHRLLCTGGSSR